MRRRPLSPERVVILGLGLFGGGAGVARYFAEGGARVVVTDLREAAALEESLAALDGLPITYRLGGHSQADFTGADRVIVNPAVPDNAPALDMARRTDARLDTEINLLFRRCRAPIAAVTGSNGKSTTTALLAEMMRATGRRTWLGGNLGGSLLLDIEDIAEGDIVVLEISSFQAERLAWIRRSPHLAIVLNITPNHLDRHGTMAAYAAAKRQLLADQHEGDLALLNADDRILRTWGTAGQGDKVFIGGDVHGERGARLVGASVHVWDAHKAKTVSLDGLRLPGAHNRFNTACAATGAWLMGADASSIEDALARFPGLPDRLEFVEEKRGVRFYNDSLATNPESTMAALRSFDAPVALIAGGSPKGLSFSALGRAMVRHASVVILIGQTADRLESAIKSADGHPPPIHRASTLPEAVAMAARCVVTPGVVLLSPACASYDMFRNYAERGRCFRRAVRALSD